LWLGFRVEGLEFGVGGLVVGVSISGRVFRFRV